MEREVEGAALDAAVARALGWEHLGAVGKNERTDDGTPYCLSGCNDWWRHPTGGWLCSCCYSFPYQYSSDWSIGGPLLENEKISIECEFTGSWLACELYSKASARASTPLVAAMRAFVYSRQKVGDE